MKFRDYYETLGVSRTASADEIQKAYRKLARKYHPDVSKEKGAEDRFKEASEAYEVLRDPEKRKKYDALGANWKAGQEFRPPPGFEHVFEGRGAGPGGFEFSGFSEFFDAIFGGRGGGGFSFGPGGFGGAEELFGGGGRGRGSRGVPAQEAEIPLTVQDLYTGASKMVTVQGPHGSRTVQLRIPPGTTEGSTIRLAGQAGGAGEDLLLKVRLNPDARFKVEGFDLRTVVPLSPWEAGLGAAVQVPLPTGVVKLTVPAGSQSGQQLRLRGKGLPRRREERGDLLAELRIMVPKSLTAGERECFERLSSVSTFNPRQG